MGGIVGRVTRARVLPLRGIGGKLTPHRGESEFTLKQRMSSVNGDGTFKYQHATCGYDRIKHFAFTDLIVHGQTGYASAYGMDFSNGEECDTFEGTGSISRNDILATLQAAGYTVSEFNEVRYVGTLNEHGEHDHFTVQVHVHNGARLGLDGLVPDAAVTGDYTVIVVKFKRRWFCFPKAWTIKYDDGIRAMLGITVQGKHDVVSKRYILDTANEIVYFAIGAGSPRTLTKDTEPDRVEEAYERLKGTPNAKLAYFVITQGPPTILRRPAYVLVKSSAEKAVSKYVIGSADLMQRASEEGYHINKEPVTRVLVGPHFSGDVINITHNRIQQQAIVRDCDAGKIKSVELMPQDCDQSLQYRYLLTDLDVWLKCNPTPYVEVTTVQPSEEQRCSPSQLKDAISTLQTHAKDATAKQGVLELLRILYTSQKLFIMEANDEYKHESSTENMRRLIVRLTTYHLIRYMYQRMAHHKNYTDQWQLYQTRLVQERQYLVEPWDERCTFHSTVYGIRRTDTVQTNAAGVECSQVNLTPDASRSAATLSSTIRDAYTERNLPALWGGLVKSRNAAMCPVGTSMYHLQNLADATPVENMDTRCESLYDLFDVDTADPVRKRVMAMPNTTHKMYACAQSVYGLMVEAVRSTNKKSGLMTTAYANLFRGTAAASLQPIATLSTNVQQCEHMRWCSQHSHRSVKRLNTLFDACRCYTPEDVSPELKGVLSEIITNSPHVDTYSLEYDKMTVPTQYVPMCYREYPLTGNRTRVAEVDLLMAFVIYLLVWDMPTMLQMDSVIAVMYAVTNDDTSTIDFSVLEHARTKMIGSDPRTTNVIEDMYCRNFSLLTQIVQIVHRVGTSVEHTAIPWCVPCDPTVGDSHGFVMFALKSNPYKYACDRAGEEHKKKLTKDEENAIVIYATALLCTDKVMETARRCR